MKITKIEIKHFRGFSGPTVYAFKVNALKDAPPLSISLKKHTAQKLTHADEGTAPHRSSVVWAEISGSASPAVSLNTELNEWELLGEPEQALQRELALEAWILVTTQLVPEQILNRKG